MSTAASGELTDPDSQPASGHGALFGGRFLLGDLLGVGGSASVYQAEDTTAGPDEASARIAVKVLHPHLCTTPAAREAFLREARAVETLRHHNIAAVHSAGLHEAGGLTLPWIALDLVDGGSLADLVTARGPLPPAQAAAVLDGVLAALGAAHDAGLVHRDISPANVLLDGDTTGRIVPRQVRLVDFGLADATGRTATGQDVLRAAGTDGARTDGGTPSKIVGNPHYLSPEHAQGRPVRAAADLYQAGALLYFLLAGRPPYPRDTTAQVLAAHLTAPPPAPSALVPAARPLDRVVTRAMTKTPARRYRTADEFRRALADAVAPAVPTPDEAATTVMGEPGIGEPRRERPRDELAYLAPATDSGTADGASAGGASRTRSASVSGAVAAAVIAALVGLAAWGVFSATAAPNVHIGKTADPSLTPSATASIDDAAPTGKPSTGDTASAADPASTGIPTSDPTASVTVPTLHGTLDDAEAALKAVGLRLGTVTRTESPEPADRVLSQYPAAGETVASASAVDITVATGTNVVPQVVGMSVVAAVAVLESAGFEADPGPGISPSSTATVTGSLPGAGAVLRVGVTIGLQVADPTPTATPTGGVTEPGDRR